MERGYARCVREAEEKRQYFLGGLGVASGVLTCCRELAEPLLIFFCYTNRATDPGAPLHEDSGAIWRQGRSSSCSVLPFKSTYCLPKYFTLCFHSEEEVQGLLLEEDLCSHIDTGELELHKFAVICKEVLRSQAKMKWLGADGDQSESCEK